MGITILTEKGCSGNSAVGFVELTANVLGLTVWPPPPPPPPLLPWLSSVGLHAFSLTVAVYAPVLIVSSAPGFVSCMRQLIWSTIAKTARAGR